MEESTLACAEAFQLSVVEAGRQEMAKQALPDEDLEPHQFKRLTCLECDVDLPLYRMKKGLILCTNCKTDNEKRLKGVRKTM